MADSNETSSSSRVTPKFATLRITWPAPEVALVELARTKALNSMDKPFFRDMRACFTWLGARSDVRCVVLASAHEKLFTAGLDLKEVQSGLLPEEEDVGRAGWALTELIREWQDAFNELEKCRVPVIAVIHGACIGGGIDLITAADIRICSSDAFFTVKEIELGMAADLGTLQRLPKIVGNQSIVREWAFTGTNISASVAQTHGLVSRVLPSKREALEEALRLANVIAQKSPLAIAVIKRTLLHARDHSVSDGLEYIRTVNGSAIQSTDLLNAGAAILSKKTATFAKL